MYRLQIIILIFVFSATSTLFASNNVLISQGKINITLDDVDGFALSIPKDVRPGFFDDLRRFDKTLTNMLTIKHVVDYGLSENIIDVNKIESDVSKYLQEKSDSLNLTSLTDMEFLKLKRFFISKFSYAFMHKYFKEKIKEEDVVSLAKEYYMINKDSYHQEDLRNIQYIRINFNNNKESAKVLTDKIFEELKSSSFDVLLNSYQEDDRVEFIRDIKDFYYNEKYKTFSDFIFSENQIGVINSILETHDSFNVVEILSISPEQYKSFNEVKPEIVSKLKGDRAKREFADLVLKLTKDSVSVNEEALISIRTRYITKEN